MKEWIAQNKGYTIVLAVEMLFVLIMLLVAFRKPTAYILDNTNITILDDEVLLENDGSYHVIGTRMGEQSSQEVLRSVPFALPHGMYEVVVSYESIFGKESTCEDYTGSVQITSQKHRAGFQCSEILLQDIKTSMTDRLWVRSFNGVKDLEVHVLFSGVGELRLSAIEIKELSLWRFVCLFGWILLFAVADVGYRYFFTRNNYANKQIVIVLGLTIFFSSLPLFMDFLYWGHDMDFHTARIWSLAEGIKNGHWIVPIQTEMVNGYGYATPLFYSQLFLYIPALIYCLGAPLQVSYQIYAILINAASCLICFYCIKELFRNKRFALFGAILYTLSAYRLADVYTRASVGEYTAMAFLPLVLYGFARVYMTEEKKITWRDYMPIVIGLTGIIRCHILTCELTALCILLFCLLTIKKTFQPQRFLALVRAALIMFAVNAAFLIPFLSSMTMNLNVKANQVNQIQEQGTYLVQALGLFMTATGGSVKGTLDEMPMSVGFSLIIGIGILLYCCAKRYDWEIERDKMLRFGTYCAGFAVLSILFSLRFMPWDSIRNISGIIAKMLCMIQYPWRYYAFATVFGVFAAVTGVKVISEYKGSVTVKLCCGIMLLFTMLNAGMFFRDFTNEAKTVTVYGAMPTEIGYGEYLPTGTVMEELKVRRVVTDETSVTVSGYQYKDGVTTFSCKNESKEEKVVEIPLLNYDHYHAYDKNSGQEFPIRNGHNNYVNIVISPQYEGEIEIRYVIPFLWKVGYLLSTVSVIGVIAIAGIARWKRRKA
jgi:hypothetical protein